LLEKLGDDYHEQAKTFEGQGKVDKAYKFFTEAANKFAYILKNFEGQLNPSREQVLKDKAKRAIDAGLWSKQQLEDQKAKLRGVTSVKSKGKMTLGL
jgi:hypothetical protein